MPFSAFPEMRLPLRHGPPIVWKLTSSKAMPFSVFGTAAVPAAFVPIRLPITTFPVPSMNLMPEP